MCDDRTTGSTLVISTALIISMVVIVSLIIYAGDRANLQLRSEYQRLFKQCTEDGRKEYECVAMLHRIKQP